MTAPLTAVEMASDALFSCVYLWSHGRPYTRTDLDKAIHQHKDTATTYGKLVAKLTQLHSMTYEDLCDAGYLGGDTEQVIALRRATLLEEIGEEELNAWLRDSTRIHKVFPQDNTVISLPVKKGQRKINFGDELGDGTRINDEDRHQLEKLNVTYTHVLAFGDHHVVSMKANPVTGETHAFQTLNSFRNNFLDTGRVAGRRLGGAWLEWPGHAKKLDGVGFYPNIERCPDGVYNLFTGLSVQPVEGDAAPYLEHLRYVICAGDEESYSYLIGWLAHMFQKPDEKPSVAVVMKSIEGTGKGSMVRPLLEILGMYGIQVNGPGQIAGRFNGTIANKLFVFIDEAELTDARCADRLKALISEPTINLERKGKDPEPMPNYARFVFASNHDRVTPDKTRAFGKLEKLVTAAATIAADELIDLLFKLKAKYRKNAVWVMNSQTAAALQKLKNSNGDYIWRDRLVAGSPDMLLGHPVQYLETMPDIAAGKAALAVGDFKRGYFVVDHTTGVRTRPDNITEPGFYKVHTDKYLGGGVVDSNAIKVLEMKATA